jgi:hypothetical protein
LPGLATATAIRATRRDRTAASSRVVGQIRNETCLRVLFVQAAWVVLIKPQIWERYGLKQWITAAKRRLHPNVLAIARANKLARIAWPSSVGTATSNARRLMRRPTALKCTRPVLEPVKAWPGSAGIGWASRMPASLDRLSARRRCPSAGRDEGQRPTPPKELFKEKESY